MMRYASVQASTRRNLKELWSEAGKKFSSIKSEVRHDPPTIHRRGNTSAVVNLLSYPISVENQK